jgi:hypothetical protein
MWGKTTRIGAWLFDVKAAEGDTFWFALHRQRGNVRVLLHVGEDPSGDRQIIRRGRITMSSENKPDAVATATGIIETLKSNPKALGAAGVAVALVLFLTLKGGDQGEKPAQVAAVSVGQKVTIQNPNIGNTILLSAPGPVALADTDNDKDDMIICRNVASGSTATVNEEAIVNYIPFVKVTLETGECSGKTGWMAKVNIAR